MKAITLHQPWASAVALGLKQFETRSWPTRYRGPILIHAGKKVDWVRRQEILIRAREMDHGRARELSLHSATPGVIVAVAELVECHHTEDLVGVSFKIIARPDVSDLDRLLGDWTYGRFAWQLKNVIRLAEPIPCRGAQGLWDPPCEVMAQLPSECWPVSVVPDVGVREPGRSQSGIQHSMLDIHMP